jgi:hypothetical protein
MTRKVNLRRLLIALLIGAANLGMPVAANNVVCHEDLLSMECGCTACAATYLNLQVTPTCDGLELTWNDIGADGYLVVYYDPPSNVWLAVPVFIPGTSFFIANTDLPPLPTGSYSFAVLPYDTELDVWECYSNIVCDVGFPLTCTNTPEFPSIVLPATMIIGFLGAVLLIQRTREH